MSARATYAERVRRLLALLAAAAAVGAGAVGAATGGETVASVVDGDTIRLTNGQRVRLVQIDAPELRGGECYANDARATLSRLLPAGTRVRLEVDPRLDRVDRYGRRLAYVFKGRENVNLTLVARGAASVWFYGGVRGRYAVRLDTAARAARAARRGLWGACRGTRYDPTAGVQTVAAAAKADSSATAKCHPSYRGACLDPAASDYDCAGGKGDGPRYVRGPIRVVGPDVFRLDGDGDGIACD
jgi:endonuclease YncB( thermonuclease family)